MERGDIQRALRHYCEAITLAPARPEGRQLLAMAYCKLGKDKEAAEVYREWLELEPDHPVARHMYTACARARGPERAPDDYVEYVFDRFADSFEQKLTEPLQYRAPQLCADTLERHLPHPARQLRAHRRPLHLPQPHPPRRRPAAPPSRARRSPASSPCGARVPRGAARPRDDRSQRHRRSDPLQDPSRREHRDPGDPGDRARGHRPLSDRRRPRARVQHRPEGRRLLADPGSPYSFRYDEGETVDLFLGSHGRADAVDLAPWVPTPQPVVDRMLELAAVTAKDVLFDIGCGDGRIVITAARRYGARGVGIDIDKAMILDPERNAAAAGVERLVRFIDLDAT